MPPLSSACPPVRQSNVGADRQVRPEKSPSSARNAQSTPSKSRKIPLPTKYIKLNLQHTAPNIRVFYNNFRPVSEKETAAGRIFKFVKCDADLKNLEDFAILKFKDKSVPKYVYDAVAQADIEAELEKRTTEDTLRAKDNQASKSREYSGSQAQSFQRTRVGGKETVLSSGFRGSDGSQRNIVDSANTRSVLARMPSWFKGVMNSVFQTALRVIRPRSDEFVTFRGQKMRIPEEVNGLSREQIRENIKFLSKKMPVAMKTDCGEYVRFLLAASPLAMDEVKTIHESKGNTPLAFEGALDAPGISQWIVDKAYDVCWIEYVDSTESRYKLTIDEGALESVANNCSKEIECAINTLQKSVSTF